MVKSNLCDYDICPVCGEPDMKTTIEGNGKLVSCVNLSCGSNGGDNLNNLRYKTSDSRDMWEILVPTVRNDGRPCRTRFHRAWDAKVRKISGGLTVLSPAKGQWISVDGTLFKERMIPVRILATREEIEKIVDITANHYEQLAILAYKISSEVILKSYEQTSD